MSAKSAITILIVDDHPLLRLGLSAVIEQERDMTVVAEAAEGRQALDLVRRHRPDVILMDLRLQGDRGTQVIRAIRDEFPNARILVISSCDDPEDIHDALAAGASGHLSKSIVEDALIDAIRTVHAGRPYLSCLPEPRSRFQRR